MGAVCYLAADGTVCGSLLCGRAQRCSTRGRWSSVMRGGLSGDAGVLWALTDEELEESLGLTSGRCGEFLFFLVELLDEDPSGNSIGSVSPGVRLAGQRACEREATQ